MMVGKQYYSDTDMLRMQRDAEARVREMQERARRTVENANSTPPPPPRVHSGNWSSSPHVQRQRGRRGQPRGAAPAPQDSQARPESPPEAETPPQDPPSVPGDPAPDGEGKPKDSTVIGDIMDALGLDSDYLLIVGLILILVNQRADTTLILALAYLLI